LHEQNAQYAGTTLEERARIARGGKSVRDVYRDEFNSDRARLGLPALGGEATLTIEVKADNGLAVHSSIDGNIGGVKIGTSGSTGRSGPDVPDMPNATWRLW
jgi:predicted GNAT superfamily acetyltransferase